MHVPELNYPGSWLDYPDRTWCSQVEGVLHGLESALADAAVALTLFERDGAIPHHKQASAEREADSERLSVLEATIGRELGLDPNDWDEREEVSFRASIELKRQKWAAGERPRAHQNRLPFIHARSFLFALDRIEKLMGAISEDPQVPGSARAAREVFLAALPTLKNVRDSVAHFEDRSRRLARFKRPLELKPMSGPIVAAPAGGVLLLENLRNNQFGTMMENGEYGEVEVSSASLEAARKAIQTIVESFKWKNWKRHTPD